MRHRLVYQVVEEEQVLKLQCCNRTKLLLIYIYLGIGFYEEIIDFICFCDFLVNFTRFCIGSLSIMVIPSIMVNSAFPGANRMFLELELPMLPENPYLKALIYSVLLTAVFHLMWFVPRLFARKQSIKTKVLR